jgi:hypothetical protein
MKLKRISALFVAFAMMFSVAAIMAVSASAREAWRLPTYDRRTGGWTVNDFRRNPSAGFGNAVGVDLFDTEEEFLTIEDDVNLNLFLPAGLDWDDIGGARVTFELGDIDEDGLSELPNMTVVVQHNARTWEAHPMHIDPTVKENCSFTDHCGNNCKFDLETLTATVLFQTPGNVTPWGNTPNEFLKVTVTCDWLEDARTPGIARVNLLDKNGRVIPMFQYCPTVCKGPCLCPCPDGCGFVGIGPCHCPCADCDEYPCACFCETCEEAPCVCPCADCGENPCVCFEVDVTPPERPGDPSDVGSDEEGPSDLPTTGVTLVIIPVVLAAIAVVATVAMKGGSKKKN